MFILTIKGREEEGAYSVLNPEGEHIVYLFQEEDDAVRYAMMLEEDDYPEMHILEVEDDMIIKACEYKDYSYTVITPDDIVVPPNSSYYDTV
jgi:hypothetical protein